ncbi:hypothetical protein HDZ31DRAFT_75926 [Schizophyllum fasciatum]
MDHIMGNGNCSPTLKAGAERMLAKIASGAVTGDNIEQSMIAIAQVTEAMGGTSSALYSIYCFGFACDIQSSSDTATPEGWARAHVHADTRANAPAFRPARRSAAETADKMKSPVAKAGCAAYVERNRLKERIPDPGA